MPRSRKQLQQMRAASRNLIMDTALKLFAAKGFHPTSIEMIARKAGVAKGLIYNYFSSKDALLEAVMFESMERMFALAYDFPDNLDPRQTIGLFFETVFDMVTDDSEYWQLYWSLVMQPDIPSKLRNRFVESAKNMIAWLTDILKKSNFPDAEIEAYILAATLDGLCLYYLFSPEEYPIDRIKKSLFNRYAPVRKKSPRHPRKKGVPNA
jgi:AcrR family transcriptional regulator